ncbi:MAG: DUF5667 domain-containing protein, partial [Chloroflexota bacterium]
MKANPEFNRILDECLEGVLRGETPAQCLQRFPAQAAELGPLLTTALAARQAVSIQPRPEFRTRARHQFQQALQQTATHPARPFLNWLPGWATALAAVLILVLAGGGTVAAAAGSLPDSPLYPVKLAAEQVRLKLTPSDLGKLELYARLAEARADEIARLTEKGEFQLVAPTARRLDEQLAVMVSLVSSGAAAPPSLMTAPYPHPAPPPQKSTPPTCPKTGVGGPPRETP